MLKIGILGDSFIQWGGGIDFLRTVTTSLRATSQSLEMHFLLPMSGPRYEIQNAIKGFKLGVRQAIGNKNVSSYAPTFEDIKDAIVGYDANVIGHQVDIGPLAISRAFKHLGLNVLLPSFRALPFGNNIPWIGYVYDFQHRYLPHFFSKRECDQRDKDFSKMLRVAPGVIVNSSFVKNDITKFYPDTCSQIFSLPFTPAPSTSWFDIAPESVCAKYGIPQKYFIICNQFWLHKDHATAFTAFANFSLRFPDVHLVCTGAIGDHRYDQYFERLTSQLREQRISQKVHILGLIPKDDQISILRGAMALIQPTLSEGGPGGGAVYDSVALGIPSIVSDIKVNQEIKGEDGVVFFKASDSESLYQKMLEVMEAGRIAKIFNLNPEALLKKGQLRRKKCGEVLLNAIGNILKK